MELIYRVKKPETIQRFIQENHIPTSILERTEKYYKIYVNDQIKSRKDTVRKGDKIHFHIQDEPLDKIEPQNIPLDIIYEDAQILIVNKPANHKQTVSKKITKNTLANAIVHYYKSNNISAKLHFMNKVDTDVSGLVMLVKHKFIKFLLSAKLNNEVVLHYKGIVDGEIPAKSFNINLPIEKQADSNLRAVSEEGKNCVTKYKVIKEFKSYSVLDIDIKHKLPHQIKVHLAYFDFPLVGDRYYNEKEYDVPQVLLHLNKITFMHPITEEEMIIESPLPEAFDAFINANK